MAADWCHREVMFWCEDLERCLQIDRNNMNFIEFRQMFRLVLPILPLFDLFGGPFWSLVDVLRSNDVKGFCISCYHSLKHFQALATM